ncbi:hypothetical protein [Microbacterium resistens]|uniref:hypothetical protein n=1 Tax=Microbacterium resistens TaxID=156977 RepID=UPI0008327795|nr:hypothetical protein [Microbacterium resistens]
MSDDSRTGTNHDTPGRDDQEGEYTDAETETQDEREHVRSVDGAYTRTEQTEPDPDHEGAYTDAQHRAGDDVEPHSAHGSHGTYTRRDQ